MTTPGTGSSRQGKYCPRCRTMALRDSERCEHWGHQFRTDLGTGLGATPVDAPLRDEAALNRTMQFTLPPLGPRDAVAVPGIPSALPRRPRRVPAPALAALGVAVALTGALAYFHFAPAPPAANPSPAGVWDTPAGGASPNARLRLILRGDGGGSFSWQDARPTPLHWRLDPGGRLALSIPPPADADAVSGTLITVLNSHPWLWRVDRTRHRLVIGTLNFVEK